MAAVTIREMQDLGFGDDSASRDMKRFEICAGVRVLFFACVGGWGESILYMGGGKGYSILGPTRDEIVLLCRALRVQHNA